jgi:hypothetical protein
MSVQFVIFDRSTGAPVRWGSCPLSDLHLQPVSAGEALLKTSHFGVEGNAPILWEEVRAIRADKVDGGATTPFGRVDTDKLARTNISGAALSAVIAQGASAPYSVEWTLADNSSVVLNAAEMIGLGLAVMQHVDACYNRARALRNLINAAPDMAELLAIDITAGWPA